MSSAHEELVALSEGYKRIAGYSKDALRTSEAKIVKPSLHDENREGTTMAVSQAQGGGGRLSISLTSSTSSRSRISAESCS